MNVESMSDTEGTETTLRAEKGYARTAHASRSENGNGKHPHSSEAGSNIKIEDNITAVSERPKPNHEVTVEQNIEKAMRVLKRKLIREGLFRELKTRKYYEKPCEKRKRKKKEALKRVRKDEARQKKYANGLV